MTSGKLYGVGVGPGNPELMTLMSVRVIKESDVIFLPVSDREKCHAYQTARQVITDIDQKEIIGMDFPMTKDPQILEQTFDAASKKIQSFLEKGKKVSFLTIGDVTVYSTFCYVADRIQKKGFCVEYVSGIPSFAAVCAALKMPMAEKEEQIHIIPGSYEVADSFLLKGTLVYMKSGKRLKELIFALKELQQREPIKVCGVASCSMEEQKIAYSIDELENLEGYLVTVIVKK